MNEVWVADLELSLMYSEMTGKSNILIERWLQLTSSLPSSGGESFFQ